MNIFAVAARGRVSSVLLAGFVLSCWPALGSAPVRPALSIAAPGNGARGNAPIVFSGAASESGVAITSVNYWITNLSLTGTPVLSGQATLSAGPRGTTDWTFTLSPSAGSNVVAVQCQDANGNSSAVVTRKFFVFSPAVVTVAIANGNGIVAGRSFYKSDTVPANGAVLNIGESYIITARATSVDTAFLCWTGTGLVPIGPTNRASLEFVMQPNTSLQANFITNIFRPRAGTYWGLFSDVANTNLADATEETAGMIANFVVDTHGFYSGSVYAGGADQRLLGEFTPDGYATNTIVITNLDGVVTVELQLLTNTTPPLIIGSVLGTNTITLKDGTSQAGWVSTFTLVPPMTNTTADAHAYTMLMQSEPAGPFSPIGTGFAYLTNYPGATGVPPVVTISGLLANWTSFSQTAPINVSNALPIYQNYYNTPNPGMLFGWIYFTNTPGSAPTAGGSLTWIRKQRHPDFGVFTNGFTNHPIVQASYWSNSIAVTNYMPTNSLFTISGEGLVNSPVEMRVSIKPNSTLFGTNTPQSPNTDLYSGTINTNKGRFVITFTNAYRVRRVGYGGILQNTNAFPINGGGIYILGPSVNPTNIGSITWQQ